MPSKNTLPVHISGEGLVHKITVGGHDVSSAVYRAELEVDARDRIPVLRLHLCVVQQLGVDEHARVMLDDETAEALKAMGWTPPPEAM